MHTFILVYSQHSINKRDKMSMGYWNNKKIRFSIIGALVLLCAVLAFVIRILPQTDLVGTGDMIAGPDAWYNLRLVEYLLQNGMYLNFDPMTYYPVGNTNGWGPLFTYISTFFAIIAGATSRIAIIDAVSWVPAVLGALLVPVLFFLGKKLGDWKTGLIAALFIAVIGGQYFSRSLYGHFDHHIAEALFSTLFCLCYVLALAHTRNREIKWNKFSSLKIPLLFGIISGIAYLLGLLTMTTLTVFGLFAMIFTLIQFIIDYKNNHSTEYLVILNLLTFLIGAIGILIYGIRDSSFSLYLASTGVVIVQILAIVATLVLYFLTKGTDKLAPKMNIQKPWLLYILGIIVITLIATIICALVLPDVYNMVVGNIMNQFTAASGGGTTVQEAAAWSMDYAINSFNWGLLLAVAGACVLVYKILKDKNVIANFVFWWSLGTFILACSQIRWEYYFAVNIALLSAVFVGGVITLSIPEIKKLFVLIKEKRGKSIEQTAPKKKGKNTKRAQREATQKKPVLYKLAILIVTLLVACLFVGSSTADGFYTSSIYGKGGGTAPYWMDACEWMKENTPETGLDYYGYYEKDSFTYPDSAYSVVAWWDFGHYIETIGERIPVANPFQAGVTGDYGVATILMEPDESKVAEKMEYLDTKYVMVDYNTGNNFIGVMATWLGKSINSYKDYYGTLAFRLYNLLGSQSSGTYNIPALQHFRLVYDSPEYTGTYDSSGNIVGQTTRVFEYVKGAVIKGDGTISTTLTLNTGSTATYEQTSSNGQFVVPYATGANGAIVASIYTIKETGQTFTVTEDQVQNGLTVN